MMQGRDATSQKQDTLSLAGYLDRVVEGFRNYDTDVIMSLLSINDSHVSHVKSWGFVLYVHVQSAGKMDKRLSEQQRNLFQAHIRCILALCREQTNDSIKYAIETLTAFVAIFKEAETSWLCKPLDLLVVELRRLAMLADRELVSLGKSPTKKNDVYSELRKVYADIRQKPECILAFNVQMLRICFLDNNLKLVRFTQNSQEAAKVPLSNYPVGQQVTYKFLCGRYDLAEFKIKDANEKLTFAYKHCIRHHNNQRQILLYLIPIRLILGYIPEHATLNDFQLLQFRDICRAVQQGNFKLFNKALEDNKSFFLQHGLYYCMATQLQSLMFRNLLKKTYLIMKPPDGEQQTLDIRSVQTACKFAGLDIELDEVECLVANLIFKKKCKAYIAHEVRKIVLGKNPLGGPLGVL